MCVTQVFLTLTKILEKNNLEDDFWILVSEVWAHSHLVLLILSCGEVECHSRGPGEGKLLTLQQPGSKEKQPKGSGQYSSMAFPPSGLLSPLVTLTSS